MKGLQRSFIGLLTAAALSACASTSVPPITQVPAADVFEVAVREICFASLTTNLSHAALAEEQRFEIASNIDQSLRGKTPEQLFTAAFVSAPVIVSIAENGTKCSVTAVRGSFDELKSLSEAEISAFQDQYKDNAPEHISFVESDPEQDYVLRFTLLSGEALISEEQ